MQMPHSENLYSSEDNIEAVSWRAEQGVVEAADGTQPGACAVQGGPEPRR